MISELFKKYDEMQQDIKINGFKNLDNFKTEINKILEICFALYGEKETVKKYQNYVRNYK